MSAKGGQQLAQSQGSRDVWLGRALLLVALLTVAWGLRGVLEPAPWQHSWLGHNGARYSQIARNYVRLGPFHLGGAPLLNAAQVSAPDVYGNHPPGVSLALAAAFAAVGESERVARVLMALCTLLSLCLLARLVGREAPGVGAAALSGGLAALLTAALPMTVAYGAHVDPQGPPVLAASIGVLLAYQSWLRRGPTGRIPWILLASMLLATSLDWWGFYAGVGCSLHLALTQPRRWRAAAGLGAWTTALFAGWVAWLASLPESSFAGLFGAARVRGPGLLLQGEGGSAEALAQARGVEVWFEAMAVLIPLGPLLVLVVLVLACLPRSRPSKGGLLGVSGLLLLLLLPPLVHGAIFPQGLLVHSYWLFGLPVALGAGVALVLLPQNLLAAGRRLRVPLVGLLGLVLAAWSAVWTSTAELLPDPPAPVPALVGELLARTTSPGELTLTNYDCNPLLPGGEGDAYISKLLEVTYASDRQVRGLELEIMHGESQLAAYRDARERCPEARWFLLMPFPTAPTEELRQALERDASGPPRRVFEEPAVWLFGLTP